MRNRLFAIGLGTLLLASAGVAQSIPDAARLAESLNISEGTAQVIHSALVNAERQPGYLRSVAADLAETLSPEQRQELIAARQQPRAARQRPAGQRAMRGVRGPHQPGPHARLAQELETLTDEQRVAINDLMDKYRPEMRSMAQLRREEGGDRAFARQQAMELRQSMQQDIEAILTPEQQARLAEMRAEWRQRGRLGNVRQQRGVRGERPQMTDAQRGRRPDYGQMRRQQGEEGRRQARLTPGNREVTQIHRALVRVLSQYSGS